MEGPGLRQSLRSTPQIMLTHEAGNAFVIDDMQS
jgi:hypothetical protein